MAIFLNGAESAAPVTRKVVERLAPEPVRVETELSMPPGAGFGASGAGALLASLITISVDINGKSLIPNI